MKSNRNNLLQGSTNFNLKTILVLCSGSLLFSCASYRPILDENAQFEKMGESQAEADIDTCMTQADKYLAKHKTERMKKQMGRSAATGAVVGGVVGALASKNLGGALIGSAVGAGGGALMAAGDEASKDSLKPDQLKQQYVTNCLSRKKYMVIGWK